MQAEGGDSDCQGPVQPESVGLPQAPGEAPARSTLERASEQPQTPQPDDTQPAPTNYRRNIWLLIVVVAAVLVAWAADRFAGTWRSTPAVPEPAGGSNALPPPASPGGPPLLGQDQARIGGVLDAAPML